ncbi:hypothetical protein AAF712_003081 [Marasmius tenuissimus]|uniref:Uncharacterized protein n=1 Tax=Marasmius tenuissimus TaxID=585030 RepID=A0ABR3A8Z4_9AGAR
MKSADRTGSPNTLANESVRSDASAFSYSPPVPGSARFSLQRGYPSIITTVELFRGASHVGDTTAMRSLAQVFSNNLSSVVASLDSLPEEVRTFPDYELARYGVTFTNQVLYTGSKSFNDKDAGIVVEMMQMAFSNLSYFLEVAGQVYAEHQSSPTPIYPAPDAPLPEDPPSIHDDQVVKTTREENGVATAGGSSESLATPQSVASELPSVSSETSTFIEPASSSEVLLTDPPSKYLQSKPGIIQRALRIRPSFASFLSSARNKSTTTLVGSTSGSDEGGDDLKKKDMMENYLRRHKALPDIPYDLRQSAVYFLPDPLHPEVDVDMPRLSGDTIEVRLSPQGEYKTASLTALIRLVTSKDFIKNPRTAQLFFFGLGHFILPVEAIAKLVERFHEEPPGGLNAAQLRVWTREALTVRIRIAHFVALWLEQYWDSRVCDASVVAGLQQFVLDDLLGSVPDSLSSKIILLLEEAVNGRADRKTWRTKLIERLSQGVETSEPTGFEVSLLQTNDFTFRLTQFDTPSGKEELARHLTALFFDLHSVVDPGSAVRCWFYGNRDCEAHPMLQRIVNQERSLYLWVASTVLAGEDKIGRVSLTQFWIEVASRCLALQNFGCASIIYGALNSPPIYRLKETLLAVDLEHKTQFAILGDHFSGFDNYGKYRREIDNLKDRLQSYIPILAPLIRDIEVIKAAKPIIRLSPDTPDSNVLNLAAAGVVQHTVTVLENGRLPYKFGRTPFIIDWLGEQISQYPPEKEQAMIAELDQLSATREGKRVGLEQVNGWTCMSVNGSIVDIDSLKTTEKKSSFFSRLRKKM